MIVTSDISSQILLESSVSLSELATSQLCVNGMKLLEYARQNDGIRLTSSGNLYRRCVEWAAEEFQWPGYEPKVLYSVNKVLNEADFPPLFSLHDTFMNGRLLRHLKGRAVLTKAGAKLVGQHGKLQVMLFNRVFFDSDPYGYDPRVIDLGLWDIRHILGVVGNRLSGWTSLSDFTKWCVPVEIFPTTGTLGAQYNACLYVALHAIRPLTWLGLVEAFPGEGNAIAMEKRLLRKTDLFDNFVRLVTPQISSRSVH
jgi:hypothetical protein